MQIGRSESFLPFKNSLLKIGLLTAKPAYNIHNPIGLKFLTRLRLGLSHLNKHKIKEISKIVYILYAQVVWRLNAFPISFCTVIISQTCATLLGDLLLGDLQSVDTNIPSFSDSELVDLLFSGSPNFNSN